VASAVCPSLSTNASSSSSGAAANTTPVNLPTSPLAARHDTAAASPSRELELPAEAFELRRLSTGDPYASRLGVEQYFAEPAAASSMFESNGFVLIRAAVGGEGCESVRRCCMRIANEMLTVDYQRHGNRGEGRYSMGAAATSGQQLHHNEWAHLFSDAVLDVLDSIYGPGGYVLSGGGGEIVLGQVDEYQDLHADVSRQPPSCDTLQRPPLTVVNFAVHPIAEDHGPTRIWPARGRPRNTERPMRQQHEPSEILRSTLAPLPQGSCVVRDARIWHGGTPNRRAYARYLPNLEFFSREYAAHVTREGGGGRCTRPTMTPEVFQALSPRARQVCKHLVSSAAVPRGIKSNFVRPQGRVFREDVVSKLAATQVGHAFCFTGNGFECGIVMDLAKAKGFCCKMQRRGPQSTVTAHRTH